MAKKTHLWYTDHNYPGHSHSLGSCVVHAGGTRTSSATGCSASGRRASVRAPAALELRGPSLPRHAEQSPARGGRAASSSRCDGCLGRKVAPGLTRFRCATPFARALRDERIVAMVQAALPLRGASRRQLQQRSPHRTRQGPADPLDTATTLLLLLTAAAPAHVGCCGASRPSTRPTPGCHRR